MYDDFQTGRNSSNERTVVAYDIITMQQNNELSAASLKPSKKSKNEI